MKNQIKNKKGMQAGGFSVVIGIILLLLSGGIIAGIIKKGAYAAEEKTQIEMCRATNAAKFGLKEKTGGVVSIPSVCVTIDKTKGKDQVPTKDYPQTKDGAEAEIREMIKNCWYEWLEGSQGNMFEKTPFSKGCFTCYTFKIKDIGDGEVTYKSLTESMDNSFFAEDTSDNCAGNGGFWRETCEEGEEPTKPAEYKENKNMKCCIKGLTNECENKGGVCSSEGAPDASFSIYTRWQCPEGSCYVKEDSRYSYTRYIREYSARGGEIFFIPPDGGSEDTEDIEYEPGEIYAVSLISPSRQFCAAEEEGKDLKCYAAIGGYAAIAIGGGLLLVKVIGVGTAATAIGKTLLGVGWKGGLAQAAIGTAYETGVLENFKDKALDTLATPIGVEVPNSIMVSTLEHARELECAIDY